MSHNLMPSRPPITPAPDYRAVEEKIEKAIKKKFGWDIVFTIYDNGNFHWESKAGVENKDRYDLYPDMTKEQADKAIIRDILIVIKRFLPDAELLDYTVSGQKITAKE